MASTEGDEIAWFLKSTRPVLLPSHEALTLPRGEFDVFIRNDLAENHNTDTSAQMVDQDEDGTEAISDFFAKITPSATTEITTGVQSIEMVESPAEKTGHPWTDALLSFDNKEEHVPNMNNQMFTENHDITHQSTTNALVDLFDELEDVVSGPQLRHILEAAWNYDPLATLKLIFNARSIHLGKSSRGIFYRCSGWLAQNHPLTLIANLQWLSRPVIEKKLKKEGEEDLGLVEVEKSGEDPTKFDVKHGVAHGYWKDLLNILALAVNKKLDVLENPRDVLNCKNPGIIKGKATKGRKVPFEKGVPKQKKPDPRQLRHETRESRHQAAIKAFEENHVYRALHLSISRLFAKQLQFDLTALRSDNSKAKSTISLCGKWAPSNDRFHDKHTFIVSSIAEIMYPQDSFDFPHSGENERELYLRYAREQYRKDTSALRQHLQIVEKDLSAKTYDNIKYDRLPSRAMKNYSSIFIERDFERFEEYIDRVAQGKANISGATLLPSTLVHQAKMARDRTVYENLLPISPKELVEEKIAALESKVADGQWATLVKRIKDSGTLSSSIAVCDVSGSMSSPTFHDKTCPMDSAIGLSLLLAEVTEPPFGGSFITFNDIPRVERVNLSTDLTSKVASMKGSKWGYNTDFVAVFEKLILPMALENKLKPDDMVKRVFVFSDMQFDAASTDSNERWRTSYQRIKARFKEAGYEMPELVFWNLAGGRGGGIVPKPVTVADEGTCLVSGYSQGMLKVFLDGGGFGEVDEEVEVDSDSEEVHVRKKARKDPIGIMRKAISHRAYLMLKVLD